MFLGLMTLGIYTAFTKRSIMNILNITIYFIFQFNRKVAALDIQKIISKEILYFDF